MHCCLFHVFTHPPFYVGMVAIPSQLLHLPTTLAITSQQPINLPCSTPTKSMRSKRQRRTTPYQPPPPPTLAWGETCAQAASHIAELIRQLPLDDTTTNEQVLDYVGRVVLSVNMHYHTHTCKKVSTLMCNISMVVGSVPL
jgi:hypothetical protein